MTNYCIYSSNDSHLIRFEQVEKWRSRRPRSHNIGLPNFDPICFKTAAADIGQVCPGFAWATSKVFLCSYCFHFRWTFIFFWGGFRWKVFIFFCLLVVSDYRPCFWHFNFISFSFLCSFLGQVHTMCPQWIFASVSCCSLVYTVHFISLKKGFKQCKFW